MYNSVSVIVAGRINFRCREAEGTRVYLHVFQFTTVNFSHVTYHALDNAHVECMLIFMAVEITFSACGHTLVTRVITVAKLSASNRV